MEALSEEVLFKLDPTGGDRFSPSNSPGRRMKRQRSCVGKTAKRGWGTPLAWTQRVGGAAQAETRQTMQKLVGDDWKESNESAQARKRCILCFKTTSVAALWRMEWAGRARVKGVTAVGRLDYSGN